MNLAEKKISRKELLNEPDEFITLSGKTIQYVRSHPRQATTAVAVVVLILLIGLGIHYYNNYRENKSHELLQRAIYAYEAVARSDTGTMPAQLDQIQADFDHVASQYPSLSAGQQALLYSGHVLFRKKEYAGALEKYKRMQSTQLAGEGLSSLMLYHIGKTYLAMNQYEQAVVIFDQLAKDSNSPYQREAYGAIARMYEMMNRKKEAVQAYRQYLKIFPEAPDAAFVKSRISDLSPQSAEESS
jgi:tetratricopeptide (TPR) repeat protein